MKKGVVDLFQFALFILLAIINSFSPGTECLKKVQIKGPSYIRLGEDVLYNCEYDLEGAFLYALKWYRGSSEFYRFLPKEVPPIQVFGNIDIDISKSNQHEVLLRNVSFELTGLLRCVVSVESTFQTCEDSLNLTIVGIGYESPKLVLSEKILHPGDEVVAQCSLEKIFPIPTHTWFINNIQNEENEEVEYENMQNTKSNSLVKFKTELRFKLPMTFLPTSVSCRVRLFDIYDEMSSVKIQPNPRNLKTFDTPHSIKNNNTQTFSDAKSLETTQKLSKISLDSGTDGVKTQKIYSILKYIFLFLFRQVLY